MNEHDRGDPRASIVVLGLGAVGSHLAGALAAGGADVAAVGRGSHLVAVRERGLEVASRGTRTLVRFPVFESIREAMVAARPSTLVVAVKSYDVLALARELAGAGAGRATLVCFTNGVGAEQVLGNELRDAVIVPATLTSAVGVEAPGVVRVHGRGGAAVARQGWFDSGADDHQLSASAPGDPERPATRAAEWDRLHRGIFAGALSRGGIRTWVADGRDLKWSKLLLNMVAVATSAALDWAPRRVMDHPGLRMIEERAWREALDVMDAIGARPTALPAYRVDLAVRVVRRVPVGRAGPLLIAAGRGRGGRIPGPLADLRAGRPRNEVEALHGAVATYAAAAGRSAPTCEALAKLVSGIAAGTIPWPRVRGNPAVLVEALARFESTGALELAE